MKKLSYAGFLLIAVASVSAVRYTGVFGEIGGVSLVETSPLFVFFETATGAAMGLLEGLALEYIFRRVRRIALYSAYWYVSVVFATLILVTFPILTTPYVVAVLSDVTIAEILNGAVRASMALWGWSFAISSIIPIVVAAIGIVRDDDTVHVFSGLAIPEAVQAAVFLDQWYTQHQREPLPPEMAHHFEAATGQAIDEAAADGYILEWRRANGKVGRRPSVPVLNGSGGY